MTKAERLIFRVLGLMQRGGFVWSGCPDAGRDEILGLPGILEVQYDPARDLFTVLFVPGRPGVAAIFSAVSRVGRKQGREFVPEVIT